MIDPGLKADIRAEKPWTMSPLLCAMNVFNVSNIAGNPANIIPMTETQCYTKSSSSISPITPASPDTMNIKKSLILEKDESDDWMHTDGSSFEENNTLMVSGKEMSADARKVNISFNY